MNHILLIGQGNIGTFVGAALQSPENKVSHYVRNIQKLRETVGLQFSDLRRPPHKIKKKTTYHYSVITDLHHIQQFDYIIIPVAHYQFRSVLLSIQPLLKTEQVLVLSGNLWDDFEWLAQHLTNPYLFAFPNFGGTIVNNALQGWLTTNFTLGITNAEYNVQLNDFQQILINAGFRPRLEKDIQGWLKTHFAFNAALLAEAARQNGFQNMTKQWHSITRMYRLMQECMAIAEKEGVNVRHFPEGRTAFQPLWWNALKMYLMFHLPGLAKSVDASRNIMDWISYAKELGKTAEMLHFEAPLLHSYQSIWQQNIE